MEGSMVSSGVRDEGRERGDAAERKVTSEEGSGGDGTDESFVREDSGGGDAAGQRILDGAVERLEMQVGDDARDNGRGGKGMVHELGDFHADLEKMSFVFTSTPMESGDMDQRRREGQMISPIAHALAQTSSTQDPNERQTASPEASSIPVTWNKPTSTAIASATAPPTSTATIAPARRVLACTPSTTQTSRTTLTECPDQDQSELIQFPLHHGDSFESEVERQDSQRDQEDSSSSPLLSSPALLPRDLDGLGGRDDIEVEMELPSLRCTQEVKESDAGGVGGTAGDNLPENDAADKFDGIFKVMKASFPASRLDNPQSEGEDRNLGLSGKSDDDGKSLRASGRSSGTGSGDAILPSQLRPSPQYFTCSESSGSPRTPR
ncbi:hypothetical protein HK102_011828 [Quaeritorhiza haematococci]|nr:hypothetical protein HK102_011828 [Quaeritorhiza haematococci]